MTPSHALGFGKKRGSTTSTVLPRAAIAQRIKQFTRSQAKIQVVAHADGHNATALFEETLNDPTVPARILPRSGSDLRQPGSLLNSLLQPHARATEDDEQLIEHVKEQLTAQAKHGGRTLLLIDHADRMHEACIEELQTICAATDLSAVLFGPMSLIGKVRHMGSSVAVMVIADSDRRIDTQNPPTLTTEEIARATADALNEPVFAPESDATATQPTPNRVRQVAIVLITLFLGITIGWAARHLASPPPDATAFEPPPPTILLADPSPSESRPFRRQPPQLQPNLQMQKAPAPAEAEAKPVAVEREEPLSEPLQGTAWLMAQSADHYTLQLLAMNERSGLDWALDQYGGVGDMHWYTARVESGATRYVLLHGIFETHAEANAALQALPAAFNDLSPWVRSLRILQNQAVEDDVSR